MKKMILSALLCAMSFQCVVAQGNASFTVYREEQADKESIYIDVIEALAERRALRDYMGESYRIAALDNVAKANLSQATRKKWAVLLRSKDDGFLQKFAIIASSEGLAILPEKIESAGYTLDGFDPEKKAVVKAWKGIIVSVIENRNNLLRPQREIFNKTYIMAANDWLIQENMANIVDTPEGFLILAKNKAASYLELAGLVAKSYEMEDIRTNFPSQVMYGSLQTKEIVAAFMKYAGVAPSQDFVQRAYYYGLKVAHTEKEVDSIVDKSMCETLFAYPPNQFNNPFVSEGLKFINEEYAKSENINEQLSMQAWMDAKIAKDL
ncbi:MAG: hypothetical protein P4L16_07820 [Chlamydiales bacterium]|nr:hypothetical protein [Chlamydiales bacterium]